MENEIKYKGVSIMKLFPSGFYEFYSEKQQRFIKSDSLPGAKILITNEKPNAAGRRATK